MASSFGAAGGAWDVVSANGVQQSRKGCGGLSHGWCATTPLVLPRHRRAEALTPTPTLVLTPTPTPTPTLTPAPTLALTPTRTLTRCYRDTAALRTAAAWPARPELPVGVHRRSSYPSPPVGRWAGPAHAARLDLAGLTNLLPVTSGQA